MAKVGQAEALSIPGGGFNNMENRAGDTFSKGKSCLVSIRYISRVIPNNSRKLVYTLLNW